MGYMGRFQLLTGLSPEQLLHWTKTVESVEVQDLVDRTSLGFKPAIQFCYRVALRSFQRLFSCLRQKTHKLFVLIAAESGLRSHVLMALRYCHVMEDLDKGMIPVAIRLEPRFYAGKKAAGFTFLGEVSIRLIQECLDEGLIERKPESKLIQRSYYSVWAATHRANKKIGLDSRVQPCHGFRKYFENALDEANIDHEKKMLIEGHFAGTRAKHYTERDLRQLRGLYEKAYQSIKLNVDETAHSKGERESFDKRRARLDAQFASQRVLEDRVTNLEQKLASQGSERGSLLPGRGLDTTRPRH